MDDPLKLMEECRLCPRRCGQNRLEGATGFCGIGGEIRIAHYGPHFGEEPPISGTRGSGNVFLSSCNLRCIYCQNHQISHAVTGETLSAEGLGDVFFELQEAGCHNINLVSPTPYIPYIAVAIDRAKDRGITIPFVYNSNAYEEVEALRLLEGRIDIYLPDFKYWNDSVARRLSRTGVGESYRESAIKAVGEMHRQVGGLVVEDGLAVKGLIVRHLVLPGGVAGSCHILRWIAGALGAGTWVSLMSQYYPLHEAARYPLMNRQIRHEEYRALTDFASRQGLQNVFVQELESAPLFVPDFDAAEPFRR